MTAKHALTEPTHGATDSGESDTAQGLYAILFATLRDVRSKAAPMDVERAKAVCSVADRITSLARAEIDMMRISGGRHPTSSGFLATPKQAGASETPTGTKSTEHAGDGIGMVTRHLIRG